MIQRDYYVILQVNGTASASEIRRAYRRLALEYHPDHHPEDPEAEEKFKQIGEAYSVLGDREKRKDYDLRFHRRSITFDDYGRDDQNMARRHWFAKQGKGCGRGHCGIMQEATFHVVQPGQLYEIFITPHEARLGTERFVMAIVDQRQRGYRVRIPAGVAQGTQFKAILGRDENRYILIRVAIGSAV